MILNTLFPFTPTFDEPRRYTGRSKKKLRPVVTYRGGIYVAQWCGRSNRFFGATPKEALNALQVGGA
jgi:hypothetical protein